MCITLPAQIIQKNKTTAVVKSNGQKIRVKLAPNLKINKNDWILFCGDLAIRKISNKEAREINKTLKI